MNIHYVLGPDGYSRVTTEQYRRKTGERKPTKKGTKPPRTREGIGVTNASMNQATADRVRASAVFPGGKQLRRAMAALTRRQKAHAEIGKATRGKRSDASAYQKPGSMKVRAR